jgi:hypothetical protein
MGDSFLGLFRFTAPRPGRRKAAKFFASTFDNSEVDVGEANDPIAVRGLSDADRFARQGLADEHGITAPLDLAVAVHPPNRVIGIVPGFLDAVRIWPRRGTVAARRRLLAMRLVRPFMVVVFTEAIETDLLLPRCRGWRSRSLRLESAMEALMPAVLLRSARIDAAPA